MNITQTFYDNLASQYDKLFLDWSATSREQGELLHKLFVQNGFDNTAGVLDCACGIGTQAIGLATMGYNVTASDISEGELAEARVRTENAGFKVRYEKADFCALDKTFAEQFDIIIAMDNALPHMLTHEDLAKAIGSIAERIRDNGIFVGSIRDYDTLLMSKPPYSPPYIHKTDAGSRISFQTWDWIGDNYRLVQYIVDDAETLEVSKFECEYRATRREEMTKLFEAAGCSSVTWLFPEETGFYQPIVIARK